MYEETTELSNGISLHYAAAGPQPGYAGYKDTIIFIHGFPELWISWRELMQFTADLGYFSVAVDCRGYGGSSAPDEIEKYSVKEVLSDFNLLLGHFSLKQAIFVGHDWGGNLVWMLLMMYPKLVSAAIVLNTPAPKIMSLKNPLPSNILRNITMKERGHLDYAHYYCEHPSLADAELNENIFRTLNAFYRDGNNKESMKLGMRTKYTMAPKSETDSTPVGVLGKCPRNIPLDGLFSRAEIEEYTKGFSRNGFHGPLNYYRARDFNHRQIQEHLREGKLIQQDIQVPVLFVRATLDAWANYVLETDVSIDEMKNRVRNFSVVEVNSGHWTQKEAPEALNKCVGLFLARLRLPDSKL
eukprot:snap_masked-scaffold_4-processed-gene-16.17-mRNA-1 protein AED:0.70 eAED:0.71 QI:0/-1/0/1/-1/1/1/0/354